MSFSKIAAIVLIFLLAAAGWVILGSSVYFRSDASAKNLDRKVENLWGGKIVQKSPKFTAAVPGTGKNRPVTPSANNIISDISLKYRAKGLFWYPAYEISFKSEYILKNAESVAQKIFVEFAFPAEADTFDNFAVMLDGKPFGNMEVDTKTGVRETFEIAPGEEKKISFSYRSKGLWAWYYQPDKSTNLIRDLALTVKTDFKMIDFPDGTLSPDTITYSEDGGTELKWKAGNLITTKDIAVTMPEKINPGPLVERISFFAPVCLIFFFVMIMAMNVIRNINVHPMHYLFIAAGFFAFNLLFAYLVDVINVHIAFFISALVTVVLVNAYLKAALGVSFPWKTAALGQIFYLVLFSYSFFFKGLTGLTIAIGSVITLAVLMKVTARIDWEKVFVKKVRPFEK